jgi:SAM-dependent methyltransferase
MKLRNKTSDRTSWYDGYIYEKLVGPQVAEGNAILKELIDENSTVLDIGCGAGLFVFTLAEKVKGVTGVDFSSKMIKHANKRKIQRNCQNVDFIHFDAGKISEVISERFDYAIMSLFLHETEEETRDKAVNQASKLANRIIISDFCSPFPRSLYAKFLIGQELFMGGIGHYKNFRNWMCSGGIDEFVEKIGLEIEKTIAWPGKNKELGKFIICQKMHLV